MRVSRFCGQISQYNLAEPELAPRNMGVLIQKQARMEGFLVFNFAHRHEHARQRMAEWIRSGELRYKEGRRRGLGERAPGIHRDDDWRELREAAD